MLAEFDGTGVPLCYLFSGTKTPDQASKSTYPGATTCILEQFLQPLKDLGFAPTFFGCDKDRAEISAIRKIWPDTSVQLCFWHAKRAIRKRLGDAKKTMSQKSYFPAQAKSFVPTPEICWGSQPIRQPDDEHRYGRCQCASSTTEFSELGRLETGNIAERNTVLNMFSRHLNMHSMIPDQNGTYRSDNQIYLDCINVTYIWCRTQNYFRLWAYLFTNWYAPEQWQLWARAVTPEKVPVLKMTMIIESHWRRIKHDYLHRFNRPRIDLACWVIVTRVVPTVLERMTALLSKNNRVARAAWRKDFKREWKSLQISRVDPEGSVEYHTDPSKWTCGCKGYLLSRFLICKHIIWCFEEVPDKCQFFNEIRRQRNCPFWVEQQLVIRPEYRIEAPEAAASNDDDSGSDTDADKSSESESDVELDIMGNEIHDTTDSTSSYDSENIVSSTLASANILKEQKEIGNKKLLKVSKDNDEKNLQFLAEVRQRKR